MRKDHLSQRLNLLRESLTERSLDAIIIGNRYNTLYFTEFKCSYSWLVVDANTAWFITDPRYAEMAEKDLTADFKLLVQPTKDVKKFFQAFFKERGYDSAGIETTLTLAELDVLKSYTRGTKLEKAGDVVSDLRKVKDAHELKLIRKAVSMADTLMQMALAQLQPGLSELQLSQFVRRNAEDLGGEKESFENIIAFGPNSSRPHHHPGPRKLKVGDVVTVDLGVLYQGYCSDLTRTVAVGKAAKWFEDIYDATLRANEAALREIRPGMTGVEGDAIAREVINQAGYGEYFGHGLGHSVGLEIHEDPRLSPRANNYKLRPGNIVTIEPGIYIPGKGGVRIEDYALITEKGCVALSKAPKQLRVIPV